MGNMGATGPNGMNGNPGGSATRPISFFDTGGLYGGAGFDQNFYRFMDGQIDEVAIYATALPPERIAAHYLAAITPRLNFTRLPTLLLFSWEGEGFILQQTTNLANPSWTDIPTSIPSPYGVSIQPGQRFFRLRKL